MSCDAEQITGYVDGALSPQAAAAVEAHLAGCDSCRQQAAEERELKQRLHRVAPPPLRRGFEAEVRSRLRARTRSHRWRVLLPLAAALTAVGLWARGAAPFVAWEVARDHAHCFGAKKLPAQVWSSDPAEITSWFERQGTHMPNLPAAAGSLELVGARYCPLPDATFVAHTYYASQERHLSLYVVPRSVRFPGTYLTQTSGRTVRLLRAAGTTVALVSEHGAEVEAFERTFRTTVAALELGDAAPR